jgi:hypothetical protein
VQLRSECERSARGALLRNTGIIFGQPDFLSAKGHDVRVHVDAEIAGLKHSTRFGLRVFIGQLRKKIKADPSKACYIVTEPWIGYRFEPGE